MNWMKKWIIERKKERKEETKEERKGKFLFKKIQLFENYLKKSFLFPCFIKFYEILHQLLWCFPYLPPPPLGQDMTQGQFFKQSLTGLNSEFSFS